MDRQSDGQIHSIQTMPRSAFCRGSSMRMPGSSFLAHPAALGALPDMPTRTSRSSSRTKSYQCTVSAEAIARRAFFLCRARSPAAPLILRFPTVPRFRSARAQSTIRFSRDCDASHRALPRRNKVPSPALLPAATHFGVLRASM